MPKNVNKVKNSTEYFINEKGDVIYKSFNVTTPLSQIRFSLTKKYANLSKSGAH